MQLIQEIWTRGTAPRQVARRGGCSAPQLVLAFAAPVLMAEPELWQELRERWPSAQLVTCSTAGEICGTRVLEQSLVVTAIEFARTRVRCESVSLREAGSSARAGKMLSQRLCGPELAHVLVLSEGLNVNGSELVQALGTGLPEKVAVSGGLAGDGDRFERTFDGRPALDLYEEYLGEHADNLPASALVFPLALRARRDEPSVVRAILSVDKRARSLTFAGDVPRGHYARLMRANFERLLDGAASAADTSLAALGPGAAELALLVSCVGRKLVLKQRIEEEVESVRSVLGDEPILTGFYSYGEISPFTPTARCELHNQTMTITTFSEDRSA